MNIFKTLREVNLFKGMQGCPVHKDVILVFLVCWEKSLQIIWLKIAEMQSLFLLVAKSLKSCWQGCTPSEVSMGAPSTPVPVPGAPGVPWLRVAESSLSLCLHIAFSPVCVNVSNLPLLFSYKNLCHCI